MWADIIFITIFVVGLATSVGLPIIAGCSSPPAKKPPKKRKQ